MNLNEKQLRIFLKSAEELSELNTVIIQQVNKPHKCKLDKIHEEIADVEKCLENLKLALIEIKE